MRSAVTIRLDPDLEKLLDRLCRQTGRTRTEVVRDALRRQLSLMRFERLRRRTLPFAAARRYLTDEDVARDIFLEGFPGHERVGQRLRNPGGVCPDVLRVVLAEHTLVTGEVVLRELGRVLRKRIGLPPRTVKEIDDFLREHEVAPKPAARAALPKRDPDAQWVVASTIESRADVLVTGDRDLLDVAAAAPIRILDPRGFWDLLRKSE